MLILKPLLSALALVAFVFLALLSVLTLGNKIADSMEPDDDL